MLNRRFDSVQEILMCLDEQQSKELVFVAPPDSGGGEYVTKRFLCHFL